MAKPVHFHKQFIKDYHKIKSGYKNIEKKVEQRIDMFLKDRSLYVLQDHPLSGEMINLRAFSITGDIRIIYRDDGEYYIFLRIGTHSQVY